MSFANRSPFFGLSLCPLEHRGGEGGGKRWNIRTGESDSNQIYSKIEQGQPKQVDYFVKDGDQR